MHRETEHNPWNYIFFLVHLDEKEKDDFNGTESYIYEKAQASDISWFPIGHAISLDEKSEKEEEDLEDAFKKVLEITKRKWV